MITTCIAQKYIIVQCGMKSMLHTLLQCYNNININLHSPKLYTNMYTQ